MTGLGPKGFCIAAALAGAVSGVWAAPDPASPADPAAPAASSGSPAAAGEGFDGFRARMALEYGHLWSGQYRRAVAGRTATTNLDLVAMNRNIVSLDYQGEAEGNWDYSVGLKGILWWPFSTEIGEPGSRTVRVEPHVSMLKARRSFGEGAESGKAAFLEFGFIPYKYNPDARNLGEYLYRSGTYPGDVVTTDGYQFMDHAYYDAFGLHARFPSLGGALNHDFALFTEAFIEPIGDITPAYEASLKAGILEVGAGAAYNRGLSYRPSKSRPGDENNLHIRVAPDPVKGYAAYEGPFLGAPSEVREDPSRPWTVLHRWTQRGWKVMGRAALDLNGLLPEGSSSPEDLRVYAEAAVLGLADQPYYYEKIAERIPVMFGLNVPTLRLLDLLSVQAEYYGAKFNNVSQSDRISVPVWTVANYATMDLDTYTPAKWRWSVYGGRSINRLLNAKFQVASDHLRLRNVLSTRSDYDLTQSPKSWYYLVRLELGI